MNGVRLFSSYSAFGSLVLLGALLPLYYFFHTPQQTAQEVGSLAVANATAAFETLPPQPRSTPPVTEPVKEAQYQYIEVENSCGPYYQEECTNMRAGPSTEYEPVLKLRNGMILKTAGIVTDEFGEEWYKVAQDEEIRYPERITSGWYVYANLVRAFNDTGSHSLDANTATTTKRIIVDTEHEMLYAYDGDILFMQESISTGLDDTPTPHGTFTVYYKTPSRYMQGPIPGVSSQEYDLPGVPWNLYFTKDGAVIHGAYWHDKFGQQWSHGCVNLPPEKAKRLYYWADLGTAVVIS